VVTGEGINIVAGQDTYQARIVEIALEVAGSTLAPEIRSMGAVLLLPSTRLD